MTKPWLFAVLSSASNFASACRSCKKSTGSPYSIFWCALHTVPRRDPLGLYVIHCDTQSAKMWFPGSLNLLGPFFAIVGEAAIVGSQGTQHTMLVTILSPTGWKKNANLKEVWRISSWVYFFFYQHSDKANFKVMFFFRALFADSMRHLAGHWAEADWYVFHSLLNGIPFWKRIHSQTNYTSIHEIS